MVIKMYNLLMLFVLCLSCSHKTIINPIKMDDLASDVREDFLESFPNQEPGEVCDVFKPGGSKGCFYLVKKDESSCELIYSEIGSSEVVFKTSCYGDLTMAKYSRKTIIESLASGNRKIKISDSLNAVELVFHGKSSIVYYWNGSMFDGVWTSD